MASPIGSPAELGLHELTTACTKANCVLCNMTDPCAHVDPLGPARIVGDTGTV